MSVLIVVLVAAPITALTCLRTAHRVAATIAALTGVAAFILANALVPDGVNPFIDEPSQCPPAVSAGSGENPCR